MSQGAPAELLPRLSLGHYGAIEGVVSGASHIEGVLVAHARALVAHCIDAPDMTATAAAARVVRLRCTGGAPPGAEHGLEYIGAAERSGVVAEYDGGACAAWEHRQIEYRPLAVPAMIGGGMGLAFALVERTRRRDERPGDDAASEQCTEHCFLWVDAAIGVTWRIRVRLFAHAAAAATAFRGPCAPATVGAVVVSNATHEHFAASQLGYIRDALARTAEWEGACTRLLRRLGEAMGVADDAVATTTCMRFHLDGERTPLGVAAAAAAAAEPRVTLPPACVHEFVDARERAATLERCGVPRAIVARQRPMAPVLPYFEVLTHAIDVAATAAACYTIPYRNGYAVYPCLLALFVRAEPVLVGEGARAFRPAPPVAAAIGRVRWAEALGPGESVASDLLCVLRCVALAWDDSLQVCDVMNVRGTAAAPDFAARAPLVARIGAAIDAAGDRALTRARQCSSEAELRRAVDEAASRGADGVDVCVQAPGARSVSVRVSAERPRTYSRLDVRLRCVFNVQTAGVEFFALDGAAPLMPPERVAAADRARVTWLASYALSLMARATGGATPPVVATLYYDARADIYRVRTVEAGAIANAHPTSYALRCAELASSSSAGMAALFAAK